jgi:hypothetical protein
MVVHLKLSALKEAKLSEHAIRFGLGGSITVLAGVVAEKYGPETGGLFLAFPAIFGASATLIEKHERRRKQEKGVKGDRRGQQAAALDAAGAAWGSIALGAFGLSIWSVGPDSPVAALCLGSIAWFALAVLMWRMRRLLRSTRRKTWLERRSPQRI